MIGKNFNFELVGSKMIPKLNNNKPVEWKFYTLALNVILMQK